VTTLLKSALKKRWMPLAILLAGVVVVAVVVATGPEAPRRAPQRQARLVEVMPLEVTDAQVVIGAMGTVQPALEVRVQAQVGGQVVEVSPSFLPGGLLREGEGLLRIDPREYQFAVRQREGDVARAEQELKLEEGRQDIARREYELLGDVVDEDDAELVLRQPQLETVNAAHDAAWAALEKARLDLERTEVKAPFNAIVEEKLVDPGAVVTPNTPLAVLVGTDACWVEVLLPVGDLAWVLMPGEEGTDGSIVRVRQDAVWEDGVWREGRVLGSLGSLDAQGRMARVLVEVADPFSLRPENAAELALLVDSFVGVEILGRAVSDVVVVDRRYVHDEADVWLMDDDDKLRIRTVEPVYAGEDRVLVAEGLEAGERLVTSHLSAPVEGMPLRVKGGKRPVGADGAEGTGGR